MISSMCSVFAESEVINLINEEVPLPSIIKGLHKSIVDRISTLARRVGLEKDIVITGGVAKNRGGVETLENVLKNPVTTPAVAGCTVFLSTVVAAAICRSSGQTS